MFNITYNQNMCVILTDNPAVAVQENENGRAVIGVYGRTAPIDRFTGIMYLTDTFLVGKNLLALSYARKKNEPMVVAKSDRLLVRETCLSDIPAFYEIYEDEEICKYMEGLHRDPDEEEAYLKKYIEEVYPFYNYGMWTLIYKETGEIIGRAGLEPKGDKAELGYLISKKFRGMGLGTEAVNLVLEYAEEMQPLEEICARVRSDNEVSVHILEAFFFEKEKEENGLIYYKLRENRN